MIKICGITRIEDAMVAVEAGADAIGFNFYPRSPRCISRVAAQSIASMLRPRPQLFGIFVRGHLDELDAEFLDAVQLHGFHDERLLPASRKRRYAAVGKDQIQAFPTVPVVLDESWGRGVKTDSRGVQGTFILAGGLNPDNVAEAIHTLRPAGVDVCSGIEASPGIKDHSRMKAFVKAAREAFSDISTGAA